MFTLGLLAKADKGAAEKIEEKYGLSLEQLVGYKPSSSLINCIQDGGFFSLQPGHRELLESGKPETICGYRRFMQETSVVFALRMRDLGILEKVVVQAK
jgi:hypothetical protein